MTHTQELLDACRFAADSLHVFRGNANPACITNAIERLESAISTAGSTDTAPTKQGWTHTTARLLTANHDKIAPVSGCRCRSCGHNALRDDLDAMWYIRDMAAYCPPCAREEDATQLDTFKL